MIYLDSSVALAHLLAEDRSPPDSLWRQPLVSSRLLEYEVWNRVHARRLGRSHGEMVRELIGCVALIELAAPVLTRALEPFPIPVRTLDALHLASIEFLRTRRQTLELASYDDRLLEVARALDIPLFDFSNYNANFNERITSSLWRAPCSSKAHLCASCGRRVEGKPGAAVPDLPGCTAAASTTDEVLLRTVDALLLWAEDALADGAIILWRGWLELRVAQSPG